MADEIGEALQRVASAAQNSGLSLEKISSWIATISSITRESASTIGRSLNSMISRYEQIKEKGFNEEDATKINDVTKALESVDIQATDAYKQLLPIGEVIDKLGAKWDTLTRNEKSYVATALAGTYQRNRLITLLDNYSISLKNYEDALNAAGTAEQKFAIYQDSVQAKLDKLSAVWEEFWQKSLNSDLIKGAIEALTKLIDTFGNLQTVLSLIATGFALWKGKSLLSITKVNDVTKVSGILGSLYISLKQLSDASISAASATNILTTAWNGLKTAFLSNPLGWIAVGLTTIISLVDIFNQKQEEMRQKQEEMRQKQKEMRQTIKQQIKELEQETEQVKNLYDTYTTAAKGTQEFNDARRKLAETFPSLIVGYNNEGEAILVNNEAIKEQIELLKQQTEEKRKLLQETAEDTIKKEQKQVDKLRKEVESIEKYIEELKYYRDNADELGTIITRAEIISYSNEQIAASYKELDKKGKELRETLGILRETYVALVPPMDDLSEAQKKVANDFINSAVAEQKYIKQGNFNRKAFIEGYTEAINNSTLLKKAEAELAEQSKKTSQGLFDLSKSYEDFLKSISNTSDDLKTLNQVLNDVKNGQSLNAETVLDLIQKYPELTDAIHKTADGWMIEKDAIETLRKAKIEEARVTIENQINSTKATLDSVYDRVKAYGIEIAAIEDLKSAQQEASKLGFKKAYGENAFENIKFDDSTNRTTFGDKVFEWSKEDYDALKKSFNVQKLANDNILKIGELKERNKKLLELLSDPDFGVSSSKSSSSKSSSSKSTPFSEQFDFINTKIKSLNQELKELQQQLDDTFSPADKQTIIDKMIVAQQKKADLLKKAIKTYEDSAQKELQKIPESLRSAVVSGSFNIATISEKTYGEKRAKEISEAIKQYQSLTDTIIGLKNEYAEIDNTMRSLDLDKITLSFEVFDKKIRESDRVLEELDYQLNLLKDNDYDKKAEILTKKIEIATKQVNEYEQELERLKAIVPANEEAAEKLQERIDELTKKFREGKISIKEYNDTFEETAKNLISTLLNTQKDIDKKNLENQLKEREKQIYDITEAEFEAYKKAKIESLKKQKEENEKFATEEAKELVRLLTEQIKLEEGISYKDIVNFDDLYKEIHNEKIKQYQDTIDMLERSNELEQQRLEREERILEIQELQLKLQNTLNNRNVQILRKKEDGSWEYDYVADPEKVEELQKQIEEKQKDFGEWEKNNSLKQIKELLQQKIEQERELIRISEETYNRIAEIETIKFNEHYENMDILAENMLDSLKNTYNNKWDEIINVLKEKVSIAEREYAKLLGASVAGVSVQIPNRNITAQTPSTGFGTTPTAESEAYARQLKEAVGGDREAFRQAEIARTEQVIANRKAQGLDTSAQEAYLDSLLKNTFKFKEGGLVDFTGLAWVDGSKTKPEAFLNPTETKLIGKLADSLPNMTDILNNFATTKMKLPSLSKISNNKEVKQIFNISKLEFPNVRTADEIKAAILDLPRLSLQSAKAY